MFNCILSQETVKTMQTDLKKEHANRIVGKWNVLPDSCMICTTLNDFKTKIKLQLEPETQI